MLVRTGGLCLHVTSANCRQFRRSLIGIVERNDTAVRHFKPPCHEMTFDLRMVVAFIQAPRPKRVGDPKRERGMHWPGNSASSRSGHEEQASDMQALSIKRVSASKPDGSTDAVTGWPLG